MEFKSFNSAEKARFRQGEILFLFVTEVFPVGGNSISQDTRAYKYNIFMLKKM